MLLDNNKVICMFSEILPTQLMDTYLAPILKDALDDLGEKKRPAEVPGFCDVLWRSTL